MRHQFWFFSNANNEYIQQFAMWPCSLLFLQKIQLRPRRFRRRERLLNNFHYRKQENLGYSKQTRVFPHFNEIIRCFSAFIFSLAKHICLSIKTFQKNLFGHVLLDFKTRLNIDHFERGISEHFPEAYDEIHMKLLNLELFISKALTFSCIFSTSMFSLLFRIQALAPLPLSSGLTKP